MTIRNGVEIRIYTDEDYLTKGNTVPLQRRCLPDPRSRAVVLRVRMPDGGVPHLCLSSSCPSPSLSRCNPQQLPSGGDGFPTCAFILNRNPSVLLFSINSYKYNYLQYTPHQFYMSNRRHYININYILHHDAPVT